MRKTFFVVAVLLMSTLAQATMPNRISIQGRLTDARDVPVASASYNFEFRVYNDINAGSLVWPIEYQTIPVVSGIFSTSLNPPLNTPFDNSYFLETWVNGNKLMPRVNITSSGYAFYANVAGSFIPNSNLDMNNYDIFDARYINASIFYDEDNSNYYVDPSSISKLLQLWMYSDILMQGHNITDGDFLLANRFVDKLATNYYVDPSSTSFLNALQVGGNVVLTTATPFSGDVAGSYNSLLLQSGAVTNPDVANGAINRTQLTGVLPIALTTDTSGNYLSNVAGGSGISISGTAGEGWTATITNTGDLSSTNEIQNIITNKGLQIDVSNNFGIMNCADGQIMKYSAGVWSCQADNAGSSTPSGSDGQVQYNNGGSFGGATSLYYDDVNSRVGIGTTSPTTTLDVAGYVNATRFYLDTGRYIDDDGSYIRFSSSLNLNSNYINNAGRVYLGASRYLYDGGSPNGITASDNLTASYVTGSSRLCIGTDCRSAWPSSGSGTVTSVSAGTGLSASPSNPITTTGTVSLNTAGISSCTDSTNNKIYWDSTNSRLGCGTDQQGGGGAPTTASYIVQAYDSTLTNERLLTAGTGISITDSGANNPITVANTGDLSSTNEIQNIITNKGLQRDVSNNFGIMNCADGQIMKYSAGVWSCQADNAGSSTPSGSDGQVQYNNGGSFGGATSLYYDDVNSRVGIGTATPGYVFDVNSANGIRLSLQKNGGGNLVLANNLNDNRIYMEAFSSDMASSITELLLTGRFAGNMPQLSLYADKVYATGSVGIGTATPGQKLDVVSGIESIYSRNSVGGGYTYLGYSDAGGYGRVGSYSSGWKNLVINDGAPAAQGYVGIGTPSPAYKLDVAGDMRATGFIYAGMQLATQQTTVTGNSAGGVGVGCPTNYFATGGGCRLDTNSPNFRIYGSYPNSGYTWACEYSNTDGVSHVITAYVFCARIR